MGGYAQVIMQGLGMTGILMGTMALWKDVTHYRFEGDEQLTGKTAIITGANSGMGKELTKEFAKRGGRVIMGCYNMEECEKVREEILEATRNRQVVCKHVDLASLSSVREFSRDIVENEFRLDILVNNAGVFALPTTTFTEDGFEKQFGVNFLGPFLLTNLLLEKMKKNPKGSDPARVVNINCGSMFRGKMHFPDLNYLKRDYDKFGAYAQSKLALYLFTYELGRRLQGDINVNVYSVHPGYVETNLNRHVKGERNFFFRQFAKLSRFVLLTRPHLGIQTALMCSIDPTLKNDSGGHYRNGKEDAPVFYSTLEEEAVRLWKIAERWSQLDQQEQKR